MVSSEEEIKIESILENGYEKHQDSIEKNTWYEKNIWDNNHNKIKIKIEDKYGHLEARAQFQKNKYDINIQIFNISKYTTINEIEKEMKTILSSIQEHESEDLK